MANKTRTPMTTAEEIIAWAEKTREANGEAFTMLNKEEQLLLAKFILAMRDHIKTLQNGTAESAPKEEPKEAPTDTVEAKNECDLIERPFIDRRQTNMEFFKANDIPMQRAFQLYQTWADVDPENRTIMDEKRKAYVKSAAFAFWLNLPHE